jgi:predicted transcriptional regulator
MSTVKTGISLEETLAGRADALARELGITRSDLYSRALVRFIEQRENELLLERLNEAHSGEEQDEEEREFLKWSKDYSRRRFGGEWPLREEPEEPGEG